jgi:hypothetical protein
MALQQQLLSKIFADSEHFLGGTLRDSFHLEKASCTTQFIWESQRALLLDIVTSAVGIREDNKTLGVGTNTFSVY